MTCTSKLFRVEPSPPGRARSLGSTVSIASAGMTPGAHIVNLVPLPLRSTLQHYERQAEELLAAHRAGDSRAIDLLHRHHPRFLDSQILWLPKDISDSEIRASVLEQADARLAVARCYDFQDWEALARHVEAVLRDEASVGRFEGAVEAVVTGDLGTLEAALRGSPDLVRARSTRVTHFDPPVHRATLLHYVAANGIEGYRQKTPSNAVEIARALLAAGSEVDALADLYGGHCTTLSLLVSSGPVAQAGLQVPLIDTLVEYGAAVESCDRARWGSPLMTALAFGFPGAAQALVRHGASIDNLAAAAGLGRSAEAARMLGTADADTRHRALALAAQHGHEDLVRLLLQAGEDPNRYNPMGNHPHTTPLHQAALAGHGRVVRLLVEHGARLDIEDSIYRATPLGWAIHAGRTEIEQYLRAQGARTERREP